MKTNSFGVKPILSFKLDHPPESTACRSVAPNSCPAYYSHSGITDRPGIHDLDDVETSAFSQLMNEEVTREHRYRPACLLLVPSSRSGVS